MIASIYCLIIFLLNFTPTQTRYFCNISGFPYPDYLVSWKHLEGICCWVSNIPLAHGHGSAEQLCSVSHCQQPRTEARAKQIYGTGTDFQESHMRLLKMSCRPQFLLAVVSVAASCVFVFGHLFLGCQRPLPPSRSSQNGM